MKRTAVKRAVTTAQRDAENIDDQAAVGALQRATDALFYEHGIAAVTVAAIRDESGVSLRRIYNLFPSKADLVTLWLRHRHQTWTDNFVNRVDANLAASRLPVDAVFAAIRDWMIDTDFRGCGFINTHSEIAQLTDEHVEIIQDHKRSLARYLDGLTGHGEAMAVLIDGAIVQASMFRDTTAIDHAHRTATTLTATKRPRHDRLL